MDGLSITNHLAVIATPENHHVHQHLRNGYVTWNDCHISRLLNAKCFVVISVSILLVCTCVREVLTIAITKRYQNKNKWKRAIAK